ncbi:MAG: hypothetical protein N3G79_02190 [Sulfolobales archaeon]|nr:hypothetical protein [Sulfolobales archaeon]
MGKATSEVLNFILNILNRVSLTSQEKILVVHRKYLQVFSKTLALYPMVFVLDPEGRSRTFDNLMYVNCKPLEKKEQIPQIPQSEILEYDALAELIASHVSPKITSFVSIIASTRDESLLVAHRLLKLMKNYEIVPHVLLLLDFDYTTIDVADKVNLAFLVSELVSQGRYTILPLSFERVVRNSLRVGIADHVEKCVAELITRLHEKAPIGTFVPLCFKLEPISLFRDLTHALDLLFFIYTGRVKLFAEGFILGSIDVWSGFKEEVLRVEKSLSKVNVNFINDDRLDVRILVEFSLRDVIAEGVDAIARAAPLDKAIEVLTNLRHLSVIRV